MGTVMIDRSYVEKLRGMKDSDFEAARERLLEHYSEHLKGEISKSQDLLGPEHEALSEGTSESNDPVVHKSDRMFSDGDVGDLALRDILLAEIHAKSVSERRQYTFLTSIWLYVVASSMMLVSAIVLVFGNVDDSILSTLFALATFALSCAAGGFSYFKFSTKLVSAEAGSKLNPSDPAM